MNYELLFLKSLAFSVFIETIVLYLFTQFVFRKPGIKLWLIILAGITATCASLPYLWFIFPLFLKTKIYYTIVSELFAIISESFIVTGILKIHYLKGLIVATICNTVSFSIGLIINWF